MGAAALTPETAVNSSFALNSIQYVYDPSLHTLASFYIVNLILGLPLNMYVVWLIKVGSGNGVASEFFSLNLSVLEVIVCLTSLPCILLSLDRVAFINMYSAVIFFSTIFDMGRPLFQCFVCVERYVAVIHPVTFLKYKPLRYRLALLAVAWFTILGFCTVHRFFDYSINWLYYAVLPYYLVLVFIKACCCVAVLKVLRQPGPGGGVRDAEVSHIKKKAFWLMMILLVTIVLNWCPIMFLISVFSLLSKTQQIRGMAVAYSVMVLTGFVHPLLYLHRSGKLPFIQR